jgi:hypothetical protein
METKIDKPNEPSQTGKKPKNKQQKTNYNVSYKVPVILARF